MTSDGENALIGRTIGGKYVIESFLGGGAMGAVWKARQTSLDKLVAIKIMHRQLAVDDAFAARFHREALAASRLDHPSSIRVFDHGEEPDGLLYIAMELAEGRDLHQVMSEDWPLSDGRTIDILSQVLAALAVAHELGVVHRDLKPENILVQPGTDDEGHPIDVVKVCDFGIATIAEPRSDLGAGGATRSNITATGFIVGTPEYMSPEQARGERVDARSDLYSAGVVLFRMLTNTLPFEAESALGVAVKHIYEEPTHPSDVKLDVNPRLAAVCLKAMAKNPKDRYQTAREMRNELRAERRSITDLGVLSERSPPRPRSIVDVREASSQTPSLGSEPQLTLSGVPRLTPPSGPAPGTSSQRAARIAPLVALGLVFAGVALFKLTRHSPVPTVAATSVEIPSVAPEATTARPPTTVADPGALDPAARAPTSDTASSKASSATSASAVGLPHAPRLTPSASAEATVTASAAPPPPAPASVVVPEAPPPTVVLPKPPEPPPPEPIAAAPAFDPSTARVAISGVSTTNGLTGSSVRAALGRANFTGCYQSALRAAGAPAGGSTNLHLSIDDTGHVVSATASMGFLPGARACIEGAARSLRVSNVDTGDATADVALSFLPR